MKKIKLFSIALLVLLSACSSTPDPEAKKPACPEWTTKGSAAFDLSKDKNLYGVGIANNINNAALLRDTADNRAINNLAKTINVYTSSLMQDAMMSTSSDSATSTEQHVEQAVKTVVKEVLSGVQIIDRCNNKEEATFYSLAMLSYERIADLLSHQDALDSRVKMHIRENAERLFDKLSQEEEKH